MANTEINELLFVDEIVIMSDSEKDLQFHLEVLNKINRMINVHKTT